jgi:hypothetical protein
MSFLGNGVIANDTGIYVIQPNGGAYNAKTKTMTFGGQYAEFFSRILPPTNSVLFIDPRYKDFKKYDRQLFIQDAAGKGVHIYCSSLKWGETPPVKKIPEMTCTIKMIGQAPGEEDALLEQAEAHPVKEVIQTIEQTNQSK